MSTWSTARRRLARWAVLMAVVTGVLLWVLDPWARASGSLLYIVITAGALLSPAGIVVQVIMGQALIARLLLMPDGPDPLLLVVLVAGVVATAELLSEVARLNTPLACVADDVPQGAAAAAGIGAVAFGVVVLASGIPGPSGLLAVVLASVAVAGVAVKLVGEGGWVRPGRD